MAIKTFEDIPFDNLMDYAGVDAIVTLDILKKMWPMLNAQPDYVEFYDRGKRRKVKAPSIVSELVNVKANALRFIVDMEVVGIPYDVAGNRLMAKDMAEEIGTLEESIFTALGTTLNLNSDLEMAKLLYDKMGMECPIQTKSGESSVNSDALKALRKRYGHEWLGWIDRRKNVSSVYNNFIATYVEDWVKKDGCIHPEYNLHGTSSHRISSDNPNLLNLPRYDSCKPYDIRRLYTVRPGYVFMTLDFSSCEVKVLAALCKDEKMLEAIVAGKDFHTYTASLINKIPYEEIRAVLEAPEHDLETNAELKALYRKYKAMRQGAKAVTFKNQRLLGAISVE